MTSVRKWDHHCVLVRRAMARRLLKEHLVLPTLDRTTLTRALLGTPSIIAQKWRRLDVERDHWVSALDCRMRKTHRQVVLAWRVVNFTLYLNAFMCFLRRLHSGLLRTLKQGWQLINCLRQIPH